MDTLYPNLYDRFKTEGLCPVCLMEMELTPRYSCVNGHTMCHRCKPYYYGCPTCLQPLDVDILPPHVDAAPSSAHPLPYSTHHGDYTASAPSMNDFLDHERAWQSSPEDLSEDQQLESCAYAHLGCWVKVPDHLRVLHESRCQFRPHLEQEHMPTDLRHSHSDLVECMFAAAGCRVRTVPWRRGIHEKYCVYKDTFQDVDDINDGLECTTIDEQLVHCKFRRYGCMVSMPRRRKYTHEEKCNYRSNHGADDADDDYLADPELDPEEQLECRWSEYGCRVRPKRYRKSIHEDKCNYRMEECAYRDCGCSAVFTPARRYAHESICNFAN